MANSAIVGVLRALLMADTAEFDKAMTRASDSAKRVTKEFKTTGKQMTEVGSALTKMVTLPMVAAGAAVLKLSTDFESSFAGVRKTVKATEPEFAALADGMRGLAKTIPINVNELNKIGEAAGQLGIETQSIIGFTDVIAKLGVTTNLSSEQAASSLARLANITQMPQTEFQRLGSTIVALGNNFATTESEIVDFGLRIAGAGKIAGLTEPQILAIGAAMSSVGIEAEAGGTAVQKVLNDMTAAVAQGGQSLEVFAATAGVSAAQFQRAFREDAASAFAAFVSGLRRQGDRAFTTLDQLKLGNERVIRAFLSLANAGDLLDRSLVTANEAWRDNTALTNEAAERFKTTASQLTLLWNRLKDVGITIGNALLPAFQSLVKLADVFLPVLNKMGQLFASLPGPIQLGGLALAGLAAATGPLLFGFGQLLLATSQITAAFTAKGIATRALAAAQTTLTGTTTTLTGALAKLAGVGGLMLGGAAVGGAIAMAHEAQLERIKKAGADLATANERIAETEDKLAQARARGNLLQVERLRVDLLMLKQGRDAALEAKAQAEADAKVLADQHAAAEAAVKAAETRAGRETAATVHTTEAKKNAKDAVEALTQAIERQNDRLRATGVVLQGDVAAALKQFHQDLGRVTQEGEDAEAVFLLGAVPALQELAAKARESGRDVTGLEAAVAAGNSRLMELQPVVDGITASQEQWNDALTQGAITMDMAAEKARILGDTLEKDVQTKVRTLSDQFGELFDGVTNLFSMNGLRGIVGGFVDGLKSAITGGITSLINLGIGLAVRGLQGLGRAIGNLFGRNETKGQREDFAESMGFGTVDELFAHLQDQLPANVANELIDRARNRIGRSDTAANQQWMEDVREALGAIEPSADRVARNLERVASGVVDIAAGLKPGALQEDFDRISRITLAGFNAFIGQGHSAVEAVRAVGPAIDALVASAEELGFSGNAAFEQLARWRHLTEQNAPLLEQVAGLNELMMALQELGSLDAETFADLQAQGASAFRQLTAGGLSEAEALAQIRPLLESILTLHQERGLAITDEAAALIELARQEGVLGKQGKSTNTILSDGFEVMRDGLGALIRALGGELPESFRRAAEEAKRFASGVQSDFDNLDLAVQPYLDPSGLVQGPADLALTGGAEAGSSALVAGFAGQPAQLITKLNARTIAEEMVEIYPGVVREIVGV